jgi:hypothetical protein
MLNLNILFYIVHHTLNGLFCKIYNVKSLLFHFFMLLKTSLRMVTNDQSMQEENIK